MNDNKQNFTLSEAEGKKLIPELRFPEFQNDGEWVEKKLGEVSKITTGSSNREDSTVSKGKYTFFDRSEDIRTSDRYLFDGEAIIVGGEGQKFIPKYFIGKFDLHQRAYAIMNFKDDTVGGFLFYFIFKNRSYFLRYAVGSTVKSLRLPIFEKMPIVIPSPQEQQKIAAFLSNLDELIAAHKQKLALLKQHKKGLMQKLFPQEGKKLPKFRFPEFQNDGEWVEKKLGEESVSIIVNDKIDSKNLTLNNYVSTDNMLPDYSGVTVATKLPSTKRVTEFIKGDILISNIRPYLKKVWISNTKGGCSNDIIVFRSGKKVISEFLGFILINDAFINYVMQSSKGVKMPRGDKESMKKYTIKIPSLKEQQKIADFLSNLDELIAAQAEKIEQLEKHKKGLMQKMFPIV